MRGLIASGELNDDLMSVPVALAISDSEEEFGDTPFGHVVPPREWKTLQPDAILALRLLWEKRRGEASPWSAYIQLLPEHVPTGRHATTEAIQLMPHPSLQREVQEASSYVGRLHTRLQQLAEVHGKAAYDYSQAELGWALDMIHSRSFTVDAGARGLRRFLVPLVDMMNHDEQLGCGFTYDEESDCFVVEWLALARPPAAGEPIFLDYGTKSSEELFLMYGFVPSTPTRYDSWPLEGAYVKEDWERAPGDEAMLKEKKALLESCRYDSPRQFELRNEMIDPAVISALRLVGLTPQELRCECGGRWNRALAHAPVSEANEKWVARSLHARLTRELHRGGASLEEDRAALNEAEGCVRSALQIRINGKVLVESIVSLLDDFLAFEQAPSKPPPNLLDIMVDYMPKMRIL